MNKKQIAYKVFYLLFFLYFAYRLGQDDISLLRKCMDVFFSFSFALIWVIEEDRKEAGYPNKFGIPWKK